MSGDATEPLRLHSGYAHPVSRIWQSNNAFLAPHNLMYPLFIIDNPDEEQPINAMPGVSRMGVNKMLKHIEELIEIGLSSVLLFAVTSLPKVQRNWVKILGKKLGKNVCKKIE